WSLAAGPRCPRQRGRGPSARLYYMPLTAARRGVTRGGLASLLAQQLLHPLLAQQPRPRALRPDDAEEERGGLVHVVVHDQVVELAQGPDLLARPRQALLDLLLGLGAAAPQAP